MSGKSAKNGKSAVPPEPSAAAGSRRKQRRPHRVLSESETDPPPTVKQELPSNFAKAAANATAATSATTSLIAALNKRPTKPKDVPRTQCGVCKEKVNERAFQRHALSNHLGLARPMGSSQEFNKKEKLSAFTRVLKAGGKLQCAMCEKCLTSALGFFHHQNTCGKEIEPVKCPICGWLLKPLSLPHHLRKHEKEKRMNGVENAEPPKKRPRRSVAKPCDDPDYDPGRDEEKSGPPSRSGTTPKRHAGFSEPRLTPHPNTVAKWQRLLQTERLLRCQMPGCQFEADSVKEMMAHYPKCPGLPAKWKVFSCVQCTAQTDTAAEMESHIQQNHRAAAEPEHAGPRGRPIKRRSGTIVSEMAGELTYYTPVERQNCPREQTEKYWEQLPKSRVTAPTAGAQARDWRRCADDERGVYTPPMKLSPAYKVQEIGNPDPYRSFERLDLFAFEELDNGVLSFCGGPVVACDWCPMPADGCEEDDGRQYLAVSCMPVVDRHLTPVEPSSLESAVQIWSFTADRRSARMEYAVCVDGGPVWDLAWCPTGSRSSQPADRLGCLALACGDGRVRVFTIPAPSALQSGDDTGPLFFTKPADFRLELVGDAGRSPCCRLDWAAADGNRTIAGVLGNGVVALWNLETTSPILRQTDGPTRVLYPVQVIAAHRGHGTALAFSPSSDRYLVTGGRDRTQQMWDREEPASLQRATTKLRPTLTDICWPVATKKLINAYDHSLFVGSPSIMMSDASMPVQDVPLFTHAAKCTSVSVNTTVNGIACGSESGMVALAQWRSMLCHKHKNELRRLLLKMEAEPLMPPAADAPVPPELLLGDKYTQVWESCGITIWEAKINQKTGVIREGFDDHVSTIANWVSNYPFVSVNKVSWNRNSGTDSWLAVGMECGLLRVLQVPAGSFTAVRS